MKRVYLLSWLSVFVAMLLIAGYFIATGSNEPRLSDVDKDNRPAFRIDGTQPFIIEFGRGSGWHGLDTVKVNQTGTVTLHRQNFKTQGGKNMLVWETTALQLPPDSMAELLNLIESNEILYLHKGYHADVNDGTQWVLWIKQGENEKSIYCNNYFPATIRQFANQLDKILSANGSDKLSWQPVPNGDLREHEQELWGSIRK